MHIPDGYLGPATYSTMFGVTIPFWAYASWKLNKTLKSRQAPYLALGAAFSFVIMMFNIPVLGGTTGHATGTTLIAILLGPWAAIIAVSVALLIQALLFGDGGVTAFGANCFNIACAGSFTGYGLYRLIAGRSGMGSKRRWIAGGIAAYIGLNMSALLTAVQLGLQPLIAQGPDGRPLYFTYSLNVTIPAIMLSHIFILGVVEAIVTALVIKYFQKNDPERLG